MNCRLLRKKKKFCKFKRKKAIKAWMIFQEKNIKNSN